MNGALMRAFWQHRIRSRPRMIFLFVWIGMELGHVWFLPGDWSAIYGDSYVFALLFGVGMIGQDVSSGAAQLILARPVTRLEYLMSRIAATIVGSAAFCAVEFGAALAFAMTHGVRTPWHEVTAVAMSLALGAIASGAVIGLWSSVARGLGDAAIVAGLFLGAAFIDFVSAMKQWDWGHALTPWIWWIARPVVKIEEFLVGGEVLAKALLRTAALILASVALGYAALRRKELTYSD